MMKKSLLAACVLAGLAASSNAFALANIADANKALIEPAVLARETVTATSNIKLFNQGSPSAFDIQFNLGFPLAQGAANYAGRLDCTNVTFAGTGAFTPTAGNTANTLLSGGAPVILPGGKSIVFSISNNGTAAAAAKDGLTLNIGTTAANSFVTLDTLGNAGCAFSFYDSASKAMTGAAADRLYNPGMNTYISVDTGMALDSDTGTLIAGLSPFTATTRQYNSFNGFNAPAALIGAAPTLTGSTGTVTFGVTANAFKPDGTPVAQADMYPIGTKVVLDGAFTSATGTRIWLDTAACTTAAPAYSELDLPTKSFTLATVPATTAYNICYKVPGTSAAGSAIPASVWGLTAKPANGQPGANTAGGIIRREGTQLQATIAQTTPGWVSRIAAFNNSGADVNYTIEIYPEDGNAATVGQPQMLKGKLLANKMTVVELAPFAGITWTAGKPPRATMILTAEAKDGTVKAMYQIVNPDKGSISNAQMINMDKANTAF